MFPVPNQKSLHELVRSLKLCIPSYCSNTRGNPQDLPVQLSSNLDISGLWAGQGRPGFDQNITLNIITTSVFQAV